MIKLIFLITLTVFSWASSFIAIRIGLESYSPGPLALFRYLIASVLILCLYLMSRHKRYPDLKQSVYIFITGVIGFGVYSVALNAGQVTVQAGIASFIVSQIPVAVAVLAVIFLKERMTKTMLLGICVSVVGVGLISYAYYDGQAIWDPGIIYLLIAVISAGSYIVLFKAYALKFRPIELTAYAIWSGTLAMLVYLPQMLDEAKLASVHATWSAIYLGVFPSFLGYASWGYVLSRMPANKASGFLYTLPIIATCLGWSILSEVPEKLSVIGGLIAIVGAVLINKKAKSKTNL